MENNDVELEVAETEEKEQKDYSFGDVVFSYSVFGLAGYGLYTLGQKAYKASKSAYENYKAKKVISQVEDSVASIMDDKTEENED